MNSGRPSGNWIQQTNHVRLESSDIRMNLAPFNVEVEPAGDGIEAFAITGELDQATAAELRAPMEKSIEAGTTSMVLDMTDCGFIDSTGLGVIVEAWKQLQERNGSEARFAICCPEPEVRRLLEVTGLDKAIAIRETRDEAIAVIGS